MRPRAFLFFSLLLLAACSTKSSGDAMFREHRLVPYDSIRLGSISDNDLSAMATDGTDWYLLFSPGGLVVKTTAGFMEISRFDRPGAGPEEISDARELGMSDTWVWVSDMRSLSLHRLDHNLRYHDRLPLPMRPFGLFVLNDSVAWVGTIDMAFEEVYRIHAAENGPFVTRLRSRAIGAAPESMVLFAGSEPFGIQYRPFANRVGITVDSTLVAEFSDPTRPKHLAYQTAMQGPIPEGKIHQYAFTWRAKACMLSGGLVENAQFAACFDRTGRLEARIRFPSPMAIAMSKGDTLFTYSQSTQHVYRYLLDF